jgi:LysR family transcriptional regulator, nod-box dependent transcriptional activator
MRFNKLDLNSLVCLDALLAERSVTRAADRLYLSRPAMSCALTRLREYFNDELLTQVGKTMVPTSLALSLEHPIRDVLLQLQAITSSTSASIELANVERTITITCSDYVETVFMPAVVERAFREAPLVQFDFRALTPRFEEELDSGDIDLLIISDKGAAKKHPSEELFRDTYSCVVWNENDQVGDTISSDQYVSLGHVNTQWGAGRLSTDDAAFFRKHGISRQTEVWVSTFSRVPMFLSGTNRIGTLQTRLAQKASIQWPIRVLPCPMQIPPLIELLQWHKYQENDPVIAWARGLMRTVASEMQIVEY